MYAIGAGSGNFLNNNSWGFDDSNIMTEVSPGVYEITYENVDAYFDYNFKFAANEKWNDNWGAENDDTINANTETKAFFNKANIHFDVENDNSKVTLRLDLTGFNAATSDGAKFAVIINDAEVETLPDTPKVTTAPEDKPTEPEETTKPAEDKPTEPKETTKPAEDKPTEPEEVTKPVEDKTTSPAVTTKKSNPIKVNVKTKSVKLKKLKKKNQTVKAITVKSAQGKVTYKLVKKGSTAKLYKQSKINAKGVITVKKWKKAKKGTYKLKVCVSAKGNDKYNKKTVNKIVKVKLK